MPEVERIVTGSLEANCYVVADSDGDAVVIDPGDDFERIAATVESRRLTVGGVLATHAHHDHVGAAAVVAEAVGAPFHMHRADSRILRRANFYRAVLHGAGPVPMPRVDVDLAGVASLKFGTALKVAVTHTPGHSPGSVCFTIGNDLYSGDTMLADRLGRTDFPGGDERSLRESVARLLAGAGSETVVRPGHGDPATLDEVRRRVAGRLESQE